MHCLDGIESVAPTKVFACNTIHFRKDLKIYKCVSAVRPAWLFIAYGLDKKQKA